ncbi:MAG: hypothetical protein K2Q20_09590 [Phycisphaerales bacterium]|nr:hypothetical protein [Phycisphaerales bacterium]
MPASSEVPVTHLPGTRIALATGMSGFVPPISSFNLLAVTPGRVMRWLTVLIVLGLLLRSFELLGSLLRPTRDLAAVVMLIAIIVTMIGLFAARGTIRNLLSLRCPHRFPAILDETARMGVVGPPDRLARLLRAGAFADVGFEPLVFDAAGMLRMSRRDRWTYAGCLAVTVLGLLILLHGFIPTPPVLIGLAAVVAAGVATPRIWPRSVRLVPGRMDGLTHSLLGGRVVACTSFDLRELAVLVDLRSRLLILTPKGGQRTVLHLPVRRTDDFVIGLLSAAISTAEPAPLPDDALVG